MNIFANKGFQVVTPPVKKHLNKKGQIGLCELLLSYGYCQLKLY